MTVQAPLRAQAAARAAPIYRLSDGVALLRVGGRPALFSQGGEALYALSESADALASRLAAGATFAGLAEVLTDGGMAPAAAGRTLRDLLRLWSARGVAEADIGALRPGQPERLAVRIADVAAELRWSSARLQRLVAPAFAHLAAPGARPRLRFDLVEADGLVLISRNGAGAAVVAAREAAPLVKAWLAEEVLAAAPPAIALHAACLARGARALLLTGAPGAGKTTLALALAEAGFAFAGDDIALLDPDGRVRGVPFAPAAKRGAWPLLRALRPDLSTHPVHRRRDGAELRYLAPLAPPCTARLEVGWTVHLRRTRGAAPELIPLDPVAALTRLTGEAHSAAGPAGLRELRTLIGAAEGAAAFDLVYADLGDAVRILSAACAPA